MFKKTILFDFDGTIADTLPLVEHLIQKIGPRYRLDLSENRISVYKDLPAREILHKIKLKKWLLPFFVLEMKCRLYFQKASIPLFPEVKHQLLQLKKEGYELQILSSNASSTIRKILERENLSQVVSVIHSSSKLFGKDKKLSALKQQYGHQLLYVGDEVRDAEACQIAQIPMLAVGWGYNSPQALKKTLIIDLVEEPNLLTQKIQQYFSEIQA
ncbi:HAD hydrolase-like protein [Flammeovirga aprica]|uniref:HAD hydrolase-like protein n=1 Tax=Flammeovirga aprica JL-4 TaxID=694437 RepID=A0A7X9XCI2_9BACT|nr:HAD hydrolase-like protein [Flammeovirga aprica]NME71773.1 HAD hydrolase-like protein [Flammeovirga aprica JL-4]